MSKNADAKRWLCVASLEGWKQAVARPGAVALRGRRCATAPQGDGLQESPSTPLVLLAQREGQHDVLGGLFELLADRGAYCLGQLAQWFRVVDAGELNRYRGQPPIIPIESDLRSDSDC